MGPWGAPSQLVVVDTLPNWGDSCEDELSGPDAATIRPPFPYSKTIRGKVVLCFLGKGDVALPNCAATASTGNENLRQEPSVRKSLHACRV